MIHIRGMVCEVFFASLRLGVKFFLCIRGCNAKTPRAMRGSGTFLPDCFASLTPSRHLRVLFLSRQTAFRQKGARPRHAKHVRNPWAFGRIVGIARRAAVCFGVHPKTLKTRPAGSRSHRVISD